jgi:glycerol kinase
VAADGGAVHATDRSQAWPTGYLDAATLAWNERLIAHQGLEALALPALVDTWGALGEATALGAPVPLTAIVADQQSALMGQGCEAPGAAKVTYGTSATYDVSTGAEMRLVGPTIPPFLVSSVQGETRFCVEGMIYAAGSALDWLRSTMRLGDHRRFAALAASVPDAGGAAFLPALQGLGAPHGDIRRRGLLTGLNTATTPGHLARAALEGIAFRVRELVDHVEARAGSARVRAPCRRTEASPRATN